MTAVGPAATRSAGEDAVRVRAAGLSLGVSVLLLGVKYIAFLLTGSIAILSDALESITNVLGALFAVASLFFARRPADRGHPYGHGKVEYMSAAFEGGLISFAALLTGWYAVVALLGEPRVEEIDLGVGLTAAAGLVNAALGVYLIRAGQRASSIVLVADGQHLLADFKTSAGVVLGLGLVWLTGLAWLDPLTALVVGANLGWTGLRLVRYAAGGLLDAEDTELLGRLVGAFGASAFSGIIRIHRLRAIRSGQITHADAHLIVPEYWSVEQAHEAADAFERSLLASGTVAGEIIFHTDPCRRALCRICDVKDCPVRRTGFVERPPLTLEEATLSDDSFWARWA